MVKKKNLKLSGGQKWPKNLKWPKKTKIAKKA